MFRLLSVVYTVIIAASVESATPALQYLNELAKAHARNSPGEPLLVLARWETLNQKTISQLTREAEVVFQGRVYLLKTYVGSDGRRVLSDYAIREQTLLAGRSTAAVARPHDFSKPLVLTALGGELTIDGVRVIATPAAERTLVNGGEYILFLMPSRGGGDRYKVYGSGAFEVQGGKIKPLHVQGEALFSDAFNAPLETVLSRIQRARLQ